MCNHESFSKTFAMLMVAFLLCGCCMDAGAQSVRRHSPDISLLVRKSKADSCRIANVSVGLLGNVDSVRGLQLNALSSAALREVRGVQLGGVSSIAVRLRGVQLSGFSSIVMTPMRGVQICGVTNISRGVERGVQIAGAANVCSDYMHGAQVGTFNYADSLNGLQLGFINVCSSHPRGVQIGVFNYSRDTLARKIGLVNINPNTRIDVMFFGGTSSKLNTALRFRNRSTYSIIGFGTHYMGLDKKFSGALFYRLGQYFDLTSRWSVSGDIGFYHVETFKHNTAGKPERLYSLQLHVNADYQISRRLGLYLSTGYGDTRHYYHSREYRNRAIVEAGLYWRYR